MQWESKMSFPYLKDTHESNESWQRHMFRDLESSVLFVPQLLTGITKDYESTRTKRGEEGEIQTPDLNRHPGVFIKIPSAVCTSIISSKLLQTELRALLCSHAAVPSKGNRCGFHQLSDCLKPF